MRHLLYDMFVIQYEVIRVKSKKRNLRIIVDPDGQITIKAPADFSDELIEQKVRKRVSEIIKQQNQFKLSEEKTPASRYASGESHLYLGREYIMHIKEGKRENVDFSANSFLIEIPNLDRLTSVEERQQRIEQVINRWYKERAKIKFAEIATPIIQRFKNYNVEPSAIFVQKMENRWGSCTPDKKIILNSDLIKVHKQCIEYVITHELCHLLHRNHTTAFYHLLTAEMPDWKQWENKLEQFQFCET
ncbi:MAG: M48 family metallopeptidase [Bacteroidales bacterium]|nr:M48 family metallopeptidase [Bacteroidales bacterium]